MHQYGVDVRKGREFDGIIRVREMHLYQILASVLSLRMQSGFL